MRSRSRSVCWVAFVAIVSTVLNADAEPLVMAYNERPPYHYSEKGAVTPKGVVADVVVNATKDAGIEVLFVSMESNRIMTETKGKGLFCSFGWFRNEERRQFANFTRGLWQDEPFVVVTRKDREKAFRGFRRLADLFASKDLQFGTRMGTSYGVYIDGLKVGSGAAAVEPTNTQANMVKMLAANRFDYMILLPAEIKALFLEAQVNPDDYAAIGYPDIPKGDKRRLMCGKGVPDSVIRRLNDSIAKHAAPGISD